MPKWIVRKDLNGNAVSTVRYCADEGAIVRVPGVLTLEEQLAGMLEAGEALVGRGDLFRVMRNSKQVAQILVMEDAQAPEATAGSSG